MLSLLIMQESHSHMSTDATAKTGRYALIACRIIIYAAIFLMCGYMFYMQATGVYEADTIAYVRSAIDPNASSYSLTAVIFQPAHAIAGIYGIAAVLAAAEVCTVWMTELLLRKLVPDAKPWVTFALSILCNLCIAIYMPQLHDNIYLGTSAGNIWHSPTYILMRLFALCAILSYLRLANRLSSGRTALDWVLFTLSCILSCAFKPSFIVVFGPAVVILRVIAFVKDRGTFKRSLLIGASFVLSLVVIWMQFTVLFPGDGSGGIGFGFAEVWRAYHENILISFLQSFLFPLLVLAGCLPLLKQDESYSLAWLMVILALAEYVFIHETGDRMYHGNMGWSLSFAAFYVMIASVAALLDRHGNALPALMMRNPHATEDHSDAASAAQAPSKGWTAYCVICFVILCLHAASGLLFFKWMLFGQIYF